MVRVLTPANAAASSGAINSVGDEQVVQYNGACRGALRKTSDLVSTVISVLFLFIMLLPLCYSVPASADISEASASLQQNAVVCRSTNGRFLLDLVIPLPGQDL